MADPETSLPCTCERMLDLSLFPCPRHSPPSLEERIAALEAASTAHAKRLDALEESVRNLAGGLRGFARSSALAVGACEDVLTRHDPDPKRTATKETT